MFDIANTKKSKLPVTAVEISGNSKTGKLSATYSSQITCPDSCPHKGTSCYAESGLTGFTTRRINRNASEHLDGRTPDFWDRQALAILEAELIDQLETGLPLRVHVVGDCSSNDAAKTVGAAMVRYAKRHDTQAYTYTHAWRYVNRSSWMGASVLASVESTSQIDEAWDRGYAAAIIVARHYSDKAYYLKGKLIIPCPAQTRDDVTCKSCKLCMDSQKLFDRKATIAFAPEGNTGKKMRISLKTV